MINPVQEQFGEYNKKLVEQYNIHYPQISESNELIDIKTYKENYFEKIEKLENKESYINDRIAFLNQRVDEEKRLAKSDPENQRHHYFMRGYQAKFFNNREPDLTAEVYDFDNLIALLNGNAIADFHKFLYIELDSLKSKRKKEISVQQQIMILQFLGIFEKINKQKNKTKKVSFLAYLLNKTSQAIKQVYTYEIHTLLTPDQRKKRKNIDKELEKVHELFELIGLTDEANIVRNEIDNLQKL